VNLTRGADYIADLGDDCQLRSSVRSQCGPPRCTEIRSCSASHSAGLSSWLSHLDKYNLGASSALLQLSAFRMHQVCVTIRLSSLELQARGFPGNWVVLDSSRGLRTWKAESEVLGFASSGMTKWIDLLARLCEMSSEAFELGTTFRMLTPSPPLNSLLTGKNTGIRPFVTNEFCAPSSNQLHSVGVSGNDGLKRILNYQGLNRERIPCSHEFEAREEKGSYGP
jgi:hypothetical protein